MFSDDAGVFGRPVRANCTCIQNSNTNYRTMKIYKTFDEDDDIVAAFFAFFLGILVLVLRSKHRGSKLGNRIKSDIGRFLGTCPGRRVSSPTPAHRNSLSFLSLSLFPPHRVCKISLSFSLSLSLSLSLHIIYNIS